MASSYNNYSGTISELMRYTEAFVNGPLSAPHVSDMTDHYRVYVYTGDETGYSFGHWYYWNGNAWVSGGVYHAAPSEFEDRIDELVFDASNDIIKVSNTQPTEEANKLWIKPNDNKIEILTKEDLDYFRTLVDNEIQGFEDATDAEIETLRSQFTSEIARVENITSEEIDDLEDEVNDLKSALDELETRNIVVARQKPNNYIQKSRLIVGEYVDASGNPASASGWSRTDYVNISGNAYVTYSGSVGNTAFYGADKSYISTVSGGNKIVAVPSGAVYIRASVADANLNTAMINRGEIALPYDDGQLYIEEFAYEHIAISDRRNLFDKSIVKTGSYINYTNGAYGSGSGYNGSDFIPVISNEPYTISNLIGAAIGSLAYYDSSKTYISGLANSGVTGKVTITIPSTAKFMRITVTDSALGNTQVEHGTVQTAYTEYEVKELDNSYYPNRSGHDFVYTDKKPNNLVVKSELIPGYYVNASGVPTAASGWYLTPYIYIGDYSALTLTGQPGSFCFYDANKEFVSNGSSNKTNFAVPETAKYLRVSIIEANLNAVNVNVGAIALPYDDGHIVIDTDDIHKNIVVDKAGNGDYTSLTEAMYKNYNAGCIFSVRAGTYDLIEEFTAYFGNTVFDNPNFGNAGLPINNCEVIMDAAAIVKFEYTGSNQSVIDIFSPFKFEGAGGVLKGGQIICSNCRYAIHDDVYPFSEHSVSIIDGVYIYYRSSRSVAIGGGLGQSSDILVQNCYVDTGNTNQGYGVFYHNTQTGQGQSFIKICNNYFTSRIIIEPYGETTKKSKAIVSNNKCYSVEKIIGGEIDNITMIEFNNLTVA